MILFYVTCLLIIIAIVWFKIWFIKKVIDAVTPTPAEYDHSLARKAYIEEQEEMIFSDTGYLCTAKDKKDLGRAFDLLRRTQKVSQ